MKRPRLHQVDEPRPTIGPEHLAALLHVWWLDSLCLAIFRRSAGSLPGAARADFYADLVAALQARGAAAILSTSEMALRLGLADTARRDQTEQRGSGASFRSSSNQRRGARGRRAQTGRSPVPGGDSLRAHHLSDPRRARAAAGIGRRVGDGRTASRSRTEPSRRGRCDVGGFAVGVVRGLRHNERPARRAVACGTATAMQEGTGVGQHALVDELRPRVRVVRVS